MEIKKYYELGGELNKQYGSEYKPRPQQIKMAETVNNCLELQYNAVIEAGTGVGKSLGYLIPLAHKIKKSGGRALISVGTKNLQSQLWNDRHKIISIFGISIAVIKGRSAYPCKLKLVERSLGVSEVTNTDLELISPYVDKKYWCDADSCKEKDCKFLSECIHKKKKKKMLKSDIVIANNTLTVLNLQSENKIMGYFDYAVFDEAHELSENVMNTLSDGVTMIGIENKLKELNIKNKRFNNDIKKISLELELRSDNFNEKEFNAEISSNFIKLKAPRFSPDDDTEEKAYKSLLNQIEKYNLFLDDSKNKKTVNHYFSFNKKRITKKVINIESFFRELNLNFKSIIFTSATIFDGNKNLSYFNNFIGDSMKIDLKEDVGTVFNFKNQMSIWASQKFIKNSKDYHLKIADLVKRIYNKKEKKNEGIVVLFTSIKVMKETAVELKGLNIHMQEKNNPGYKENFLADDDGILFGVKSSWTGMDIKGDKLKYLIIAGLPFDAPTWENKKISDYLESVNKNPFMDYSVPKMINTLRQGVGRLIRTVDDTGFVFIIGNNLFEKKSYIQRIKNSLPVKIKEF